MTTYNRDAVWVVINLISPANPLFCEMIYPVHNQEIMTALHTDPLRSEAIALPCTLI